MENRWKVVCEYDGTDFCGWQVQPNGNTVQEVIEKRLEAVFKKPIRIHGSGRTDSGVHARGQVFHFDAEWNHEPEKLHRALSNSLPESILFKKLLRVSDHFHSRFSATGKHYRYNLYLGPIPPHLARYCWSIRNPDALDLTQVDEAMEKLIGWHDFASFAVNRGEAYESTWRCISRAESRLSGKLLILNFEGNGFLYKMVRGLTGAVLGVGKGQLSIGELEELLEGKERKALVMTVPAKGLSLEHVYYRKRNYPHPPPHAKIPGSSSIYQECST